MGHGRYESVGGAGRPASLPQPDFPRLSPTFPKVTVTSTHHSHLGLPTYTGPESAKAAGRIIAHGGASQAEPWVSDTKPREALKGRRKKPRGVGRPTSLPRPFWASAGSSCRPPGGPSSGPVAGVPVLEAPGSERPSEDLEGRTRTKENAGRRLHCPHSEADWRVLEARSAASRSSKRQAPKGRRRIWREGPGPRRTLVGGALSALRGGLRCYRGRRACGGCGATGIPTATRGSGYAGTACPCRRAAAAQKGRPLLLERDTEQRLDRNRAAFLKSR